MTVRVQSGFTLIELMTAAMLLAVLTTAAVALSAQLFRSNEHSAAYTADVSECRAALHAVQRDVRAARAIELREDGAILRGDDGEVVYRFVNGVLERQTGERREAVARGLGACEFESEGALVHFRVTATRRSRVPGRRDATIATTVRMRRWGSE